MLKINEIFGPTLQGEGKSTGLPVLFIRTSLCNLHCIWCDTPYTWNWEGTSFKHDSPQKYSKALEIHEMTVREIMERVRCIKCKAVVLSGGEPLIQHKQLVPLLQKLKEEKYWVEVETNGTIYPNEEFIGLVDQVNCSPKLSNSNNSAKEREVSKVLMKLAQNPKVNFKFVIANKVDAQEVIRLTSLYKMKDVYLMPLGLNKDQLKETTKLTHDLSIAYGFKFTDRLHITLFGGGRGV